MQEQVDVAIVMKAMELAYTNELDSLTLVAGDGDFRDCVEFITKTVQKKVSIFGYKSSFNESLTSVATPGCTFKLDDIWEHISEPIPAHKLTGESPEDEEDKEECEHDKSSKKESTTN